MILRDSYEIPEEVAAGPHSPAFSRFLWNWFGDTTALTHGELDITFTGELTPEELSLARQLIRNNLGLKYDHIIEGAAALRDAASVPLLLKMFNAEKNLSRKLVIAGALWKIARDPAFVVCLEEARTVNPRLFVGRHLLQVLWLENERAVDFLIDLLDQEDRMVLSFTLGLLNELEFGRRMAIHYSRMPHQPADYRRLRDDPAFRAHMVAAIRKHNAESRNGW